MVLRIKNALQHFVMRDAPALQSGSWNAGLAIDPTEFSRQLVNLHTSMRQANAPTPCEEVQAVLSGRFNAGL
jgi:hypothetical protein